MAAPLFLPQSIDSPDMRQAGRELLSLALIDARNHTLHLLSLYEDAEDAIGSAALPVVRGEGVLLPPWLAGHVGWFSEWWIARNTQRAFGIDCPVRPTRLASIEPHADDWWSLPPTPGTPSPDAEATRAYLLETLECTLDLLERAAETEAGLYFYRLALFHEDRYGEALVVTAQTLGLPIGVESPLAAVPREPLLLPATRWTLGRPEGQGGFGFAQDSGTLVVDVPAFEIDAQPVSWQQFAEFVDDGGYDRSELWLPGGQAWLAAQVEGRRAPRHIEQIGASRRGQGGAILQRRFGRVVQAAGHQPAVHLSWWEADAWARWAGRRIATEVEWEIAAHAGAHRGFRWGALHEWTAGTLRPWPGYRPDPWSAGTDFDPAPAFGQARVLRGASFATRARLRSPRARGFARPERDDGFFGFRTCAL
ncbi:SUMF1/EgtB/PvdO family nonheme iron enzyme [Variovorax sp. ZT4R33]|uniref:SUMF1/EgtB/PvdO family nonheme iron enzyme n=1 Tax=Variovorax sp. ZT4R33 TaxID=3443743 RepID=UPI003F482689